MTPPPTFDTGDFGTDGGTSRRARRAQSVVKVLAFLGSRTALISGLYAWALTVFSVAYESKDAVPMTFAVLALLVLLVSTVRPSALSDAWVVATDAFIGLSLAVWLTVPKDGLVHQVSTLEGASGMVGWGVFVLASFGAPAVAVPRSDSAVPKTPLLTRLRHPSIAAEVVLLLLVAAAFGLQLLLWDVRSKEMAVLVRLLLLAGSVTLLSVAGPLSLRVAMGRPGGRVVKPRLPLQLAKRK